MTNYENQKNMSIEEMAKFNVKEIIGEYYYIYVTSDKSEFEYNKYDNAIQYEIKWLNEEIKLPKVGKSLIGQKIKSGQKFKVINIKPHKESKYHYVCLDEYINKIGKFNGTFRFDETSFWGSAQFEKEYMNAIDKENEYLRWRWDEVELLED